MATVNNTDIGASPGQAGSSGGPQEQLLDDIKKTKGKLEKLEEEIKELKERDVEIFVADWRFSSREKLEAALLRLEHKEELLNDRLNTYEARLTAQQQQQQQSGAGASVSVAYCVLVSCSKLVVRMASHTIQGTPAV